MTAGNMSRALVCPPEIPEMRAAPMPGRIVSYIGSSLLTGGGGVLVAQGEVSAANSTAINTGIGVIIMGLATFLAPHVSAAIKDWREERRKGYQGRITALEREVTDLRNQATRSNHMQAIAFAIIAENRQWMVNAHIQSKIPLPEGFMQRPGIDDFGTGEYERMTSSAVPELRVVETIEGHRSLPTPKPPAKKKGPTVEPSGPAVVPFGDPDGRD